MAKKELPYFTRRNRWGFGYEVGDHEKFRLHYASPNEKEAKKACDMLNEGKDIKLLPKPSDQWEPRLVIFKEKHYNRYFLIKTIQEFREVALKIFNERRKEGWYWFDDLKKKPEAPLSEEQIKALPNETLKKSARERNASLIREAQDYKELESHKKMYDAIIAKKDATLALRFLEERREGEYEKFEIEDFEGHK